MNLAVLNFGEIFWHFDPVCAGSNPARVMDVCYGCRMSTTNLFRVQRNPTDCDASLCVIWKPHE
jgi:hypothetical protein